MISRIFIERPKLAFVISIVTVLAGAICIFRLPVAEYPEIAPPSIMVSASYPGASAEVIANTVATVVEEQVNGIEGMIYFSSTSSNAGSYSLTITFEPGTDTDIAQVNVQNAVRRAEPSLPSEVKALGINIKKRSSDILAMYSFTTDGSTLSDLELSNWVRMNVRDGLSRIDGISDAEIMGVRNYSMRIWLDPLRMSALGITPEDIAAAVQNQNVQAAVGTVGAEYANDYLQLKINTLGRLTTVDEFGDIVVKVGDKGRQTRLRDIARIELGSENYSAEAKWNGRLSIALAIYRNTDANAIEVVDQANAFLEEVRPRLPKGVEFELGYDPTEYIRTTMNEIVDTLIITLLLVVGITYLFLQDWRATLIPTLAIPVSLVGTFVFMIALGFTINVLTMFALILVIGSLVDDAIVVVENCMRILEEEDISPKEATIKSMRRSPRDHRDHAGDRRRLRPDRLLRRHGRHDLYAVRGYDVHRAVPVDGQRADAFPGALLADPAQAESAQGLFLLRVQHFSERIAQMVSVLCRNPGPAGDHHGSAVPDCARAESVLFREGADAVPAAGGQGRAALRHSAAPRRDAAPHRRDHERILREGQEDRRREGSDHGQRLFVPERTK